MIGYLPERKPTFFYSLSVEDDRLTLIKGAEVEGGSHADYLRGPAVAGTDPASIAAVGDS